MAMRMKAVHELVQLTKGAGSSSRIRRRTTDEGRRETYEIALRSVVLVCSAQPKGSQRLSGHLETDWCIAGFDGSGLGHSPVPDLRGIRRRSSDRIQEILVRDAILQSA